MTGITSERTNDLMINALINTLIHPVVEVSQRAVNRAISEKRFLTPWMLKQKTFATRDCRVSYLSWVAGLKQQKAICDGAIYDKDSIDFVLIIKEANSIEGVDDELSTWGYKIKERVKPNTILTEEIMYNTCYLLICLLKMTDFMRR